MKGYKILARRYKTPVGEIDLIVKRKNTVIAVEVKARKTHAIAKESINHVQQSRIEKSLLWWVRANRLEACSLRFDVVTIVPGKFPYHIRNAWRASS
ncbi:hypothetical protein GCM10017044_07230 [Kordiimonas sediminis]|uniref:YraN family protein n=1 Tax=Kordiimonas sediminis TaxID=1735581 RepID=A0A919AMD1_9PROT|nr:hypothetical protein GCM10017044_07230 [Kordiimonas sediminis]